MILQYDFQSLWPVIRVWLGDFFFVIEQNRVVAIEESTAIPRSVFRPQGKRCEIWRLADCGPKIRELFGLSVL